MARSGINAEVCKPVRSMHLSATLAAGWPLTSGKQEDKRVVEVPANKASNSGCKPTVMPTVFGGGCELGCNAILRGRHFHAMRTWSSIHPKSPPFHLLCVSQEDGVHLEQLGFVRRVCRVPQLIKRVLRIVTGKQCVLQFHSTFFYYESAYVGCHTIENLLNHEAKKGTGT